MVRLVLALVALVCGIAELALLVALARTRSRPLATDASPPPSFAEPTRDRYYWGLFYVDGDDPRGVVPKRWGLGWTINFRTKAKARLFAILLVITLAVAALLASGVLPGRA